jgi:hypothetical protein
MDWSPELPFYADRRALMLPNWMPRDLDTPMLKRSLANLGTAEVGALIACPTRPADAAFSTPLAEQLSLDPVPKWLERCPLFTRSRETRWLHSVEGALVPR